MSETANRGRRWPWLALAAGLFLIGGPIAWRFRPLNSTERRLAGTWIGVENGNVRLRFSETRQYDGMAIRVFTDPLNRTVYVFEPVEGARWVASPTRIQLRLSREAGSSLSTFFRDLFLGENTVEMSLTIEDLDRIVVNDRLFVRVRE